jgi:chemotaxis receptor (MCP) glutamine deamidase CheD
LCVEKIASGAGVVFFNPQYKFAAGIHVLRGVSEGNWPGNPCYFADTAVDHVIGEFKKQGIPLNLSIAIAGGASLLTGSNMTSPVPSVVQAVKDVLADRNLPVKLESVGGTKIRSIILNVIEGKIKID